jgi:hypothetical protein
MSTPDSLAGLFDVIDWYFANFTEVHPQLAKMIYGVYAAYDPVKHAPAKVVVPGTKGKRSLPFRYFVATYADHPIFVGNHYADPDLDSEEVNGEFKVDRTWDYPYDLEEPGQMHLLTWERLADAVEDDENEMWRSGFPYAIPMAKLTHDFRESIYSKNIDEIHERPKGVGEESSIKFLRALATGCTYNGKGEYFPKWKPGKENRPPYETNTSSPFVDEAFLELELMKDQLYVAITGPLGLILYRIVDDAQLGHRREYAGGIPESQYLDTESIKKKGKIPYEMYWIVTADGTEKPPKHTKRKTKGVPGDTSTIEVVDPEAIVIDTIGKKGAAELGLSAPFDWFVELVALRFPERFRVIDLRGHHNTWKLWGGVPLNAARDGVHPMIKKALDSGKSTDFGVFSAAARAKIEEAMKDENLLVLPQGLPTGSERLIGVDSTYAYLRSLESGLISVMPIDGYLSALAASSFGAELYESTKWIIPMAKAVAYTAAIAVGGWAAVEYGATAAGVRAWATNYARKEITNKVLWGVVKRFGPALAAKLADLVLALWDDTDDPADTAGVWRAFANGFFQGYVVQTLYDNLYKKVEKIVTAGPKEYRMAVTITKVYHAMDKLQAVFSRLEDELDEAGVQKAIQNFQKSVEHLIKGVALLVSAVYYVEHKDAASMLDLFGRGGPKKEAPTAEEWEAEASAHVAKIAENIDDAFKKLGSIDDIIGEIRDNKAVMTGAVLLVMRKQLASVIKYTWTHRKGKPPEKKPINYKRKVAFYAAAIGAVLLLAADDGDTTGVVGEVAHDAVHDMIVLVSEMVSGFPGKNEDQARLYGKIVGNLLGGFVLDRFLFKDDHAFRKVMDAPIIAPTLKNNLKHGVVKGFLALIFKRYLSLYNDLVKNGILSKPRRETEFASLVNEIREIELKKKGMEHLAAFESESEKSMSLQDLALALISYHRVVQEDGIEILKKHYGDEVTRLKDDLKAAAKLSDELGITGFAEEQAKALFVVMNTHLQLAVSELAEAVKGLFEPFTENGHFSWMMLLKELGFDVGDISQIQNEVRKMYADRLSDFAAKSD